MTGCGTPATSEHWQPRVLRTRNQLAIKSRTSLLQVRSCPVEATILISSMLPPSWQTKASCRTLSRTRHEYRETAHISTIVHNMRIAWIDALSRSRSRKTTVGCASMGSTENSEHSTGSRDGDGAPSRH